MLITVTAEVTYHLASQGLCSPFLTYYLAVRSNQCRQLYSIAKHPGIKSELVMSCLRSLGLHSWWLESGLPLPSLAPSQLSMAAYETVAALQKDSLLIPEIMDLLISPLWLNLSGFAFCCITYGSQNYKPCSFDRCYTQMPGLFVIVACLVSCKKIN